jgi:hypothetical protein
MIHFNIFLPSMPVFPKWSFNQNVRARFISTMLVVPFFRIFNLFSEKALRLLTLFIFHTDDNKILIGVSVINMQVKHLNTELRTPAYLPLTSTGS